EMVAIEQALRWAAQHMPGKNIAIVTDSLTARTVLLRGRERKGDHEIRGRCQVAAKGGVDTGGTVRIAGGPSHIGIRGNDEAEAEGKTARDRAGDGMLLPPSKTEVHTLLAKAVWEEWEGMGWRTASTGRHRFEVDPQLRKRPAVKLRRRDDVLLTRLRCGS